MAPWYWRSIRHNVHDEEKDIEHEVTSNYINFRTQLNPRYEPPETDHGLLQQMAASSHKLTPRQREYIRSNCKDVIADRKYERNLTPRYMQDSGHDRAIKQWIAIKKAMSN